MIYIFLILCSFEILIIPEINSANILGIFPYNGRSHFAFFRPLMIALAERGHNVTVMGHYPLKNAIPGYTDINLSGSLSGVLNNKTFDNITSRSKLSSVTAHWNQIGYRICDRVMTTPIFQSLSNSSDDFDLIITEVFGTECFQAFAYKFRAPLIGMMSTVMLPHAADMIDLPQNPSYVTVYGLPFTNNMNLFERTVNFLALIGYKLGHHFISRINSEHLARQLLPNMPPLLEISNNISLIISNSHFSIHNAKPGVPALVEAGGIHITKPKRLEKDLSRVFDEATHGVIYFCLGSLIRTETLPLEQLNAFISVFRSVPQRVLWKLNGTAPKNLPNNVIIRPWLPQLDVLCHPKVVAFITHGGLMGTQEAVYCGVPMIGIPLFGDQDQNIANYESRGFAVHVDLHRITEIVLKDALDEVVNNTKYKHNALYYSKLFRDRPQTALDSAVYWTEYVIRYEGAPQLRTSARFLNWFQYLLIDVIFVLLITTILFFYMARITFRNVHIFFIVKLNDIQKRKVD